MCFVGDHPLFMLFVSIKVHWSPARLSYQMTFGSFNGNKMGVTVEQELLTIPDHQSSPSGFSGARLTFSLSFF